MQIYIPTSPSRLLTIYVLIATAWLIGAAFLLHANIDNEAVVLQLELASAAVLILFNVAFIYLYLFPVMREKDGRSVAAGPAMVETTGRKRVALLIGLLYLAAPVFMLVIAAIEIPWLKQDAFKELTEIAELKSRQIERWVTARNADAQTLSNDPGFRRMAAQVMDQAIDKDEDATLGDLRARLEAFRVAYGYSAVVLFDDTGKAAVHVGVDSKWKEHRYNPELDDPFNRFSYHVSDESLHFNIVEPLPLEYNGAQKTGTLLLDIKPSVHIDTYISRWPVDSRTGETLLATRSNGKVLFLTPLRHRPDRPGTLTHSLADTELPAAVALLRNDAGRFVGRDYRGVEVLSVYRPIAGTDWQLVAKLDRAEVLEPLYPMIAWIGAIVLFAATLVSIQLQRLWRQQQQLQALAIRAEKRKISILQQQFLDLPFVGIAITSPKTKRWLRYNNRLCEILGYPRKELAEKDWAELTYPDDLNKDVAEFEKVMDGRSDGYSMDKRFIRGDGTVIDAYIDVKCVRDDSGAVDYFVARVQDISERKRAEREHTDLHRLLDFALDNLPVPALIVRAQDFRITHINRYAKALMQRLPEDIASITPDQWREYWLAFRPDGSAFPVEEMPLFRAVETGESFRDAEMIIRRDGDEHWVLTSSSPLRDDSGAITAAIVAFPEITALKKTLTELDSARARTQYYLDVAAVMMLSLDRDGRIQLANRTACELLGYEQEELLMQDWFEQCVPAGPRDEVRQVFQHLMAGKTEAFRHFESNVVVRDGTQRTISWHNTALRDQDGMISGVLTFGSDVTEQRRAEQGLIASEARMKTLVKTIPDLVWLKEAEGVYLACNPASERFFGAQESDIVGRTDYDFVDRELADDFRTHDLKAMEAGHPSSNEVTLTFATDGYTGVFETVKTPMYDENGCIVGVLGIARDITERKQALSRIERLTSLYATLSETNQAIVRIDDEQQLLDAICRNAVEYGGFRMAWIGMIDAAAQRLVPVASAGDDRGYLLDIDISTDPGNLNSADPAAAAVREAKPHWCQDIASDPGREPWRQRAVDAGFAASAALPVFRNGRVVGAFKLYSETRNTFDEDVRRLLIEMAHNIGFALDNFQLERERREAEERLSLVIKGSRDAPWDWDLVNDRLWYSPQFWEMIGEEVNEYPQDSGLWREYVHPEDILRLEEAIERISQPGHEWEQVETRTRHRDGYYIPTLVRGYATRDHHGNVVRLTGTVMDLTEQKRIEEQLRAQRNQIERARRILDTHLENSPLGVIEWDADFRVKRWSAQAEVIFHWSEEEVLRKHPGEWRFVHEADREEIERVMQHLTSGTRPRNHVSNRNYTRDGDIRQIEWYNSALYDENGNLVSILSLLQDVTEQYRAQEELRMRESLLNQIFETLPVGLWIADADGKLVRGNPAGVAIWGAEPHVSPDEYGVFKARRLPSSEQVEADDWALAHTVREGVTVTDELLEIDTFDGKQRTILNYTAPVKNDRGVVEGAVVVNLDITERQQIQTRMEEQLDELNRWYETTIGREERVIELKQEINKLLQQQQRPPRYPNAESAADDTPRMNDRQAGTDNNEYLGSVITMTDVNELAQAERVARNARDELAQELDRANRSRRVLLSVLEDARQTEEALKDSEAHFRLALANLPLSVWNMDVSLRYEWVYDHELGRDAASILGMTDAELFEPDDARRLTDIKRKVLETGESVTREVGVVTAGKHQTYNLYVEPRLDDRSNIDGIIGAALNITETRELESIQKKLSEALFHSATPIALADRQNRFELVNDAFIELFGYSQEEIQGQPVSLISPGKDVETPRSEQVLEEVERSGIYRGEVLRCTRDGEIIPLHLTLAPILDVNDRRVGVVGTFNDMRPYKASEARVRSALTDTISAISLTVEKRDPYTAGHQQRVADLAKAISIEMGLDAGQIEGVYLGSLIHDIGKIYIPAEILNRPGRLSENEFGLIKSHPEVGFEIIRDVKFDWPIADIVYQHHERIDGTGYPRGLAGDEILLEARIVAVADIIEAMTSHRPYRPGLGIDRALAQIEKEAGTKLDSGIVDICLRLFREQGFAWKDPTD